MSDEPTNSTSSTKKSKHVVLASEHQAGAHDQSGTVRLGDESIGSHVVPAASRLAGETNDPNVGLSDTPPDKWRRRHREVPVGYKRKK